MVLIYFETSIVRSGLPETLKFLKHSLMQRIAGSDRSYSARSSKQSAIVFFFQLKRLPDGATELLGRSANFLTRYMPAELAVA